MLHHLLLSAASWFKSEEKSATADIKDKDWASPHTLLLLALVTYILWTTKLLLTADHLRLVADVFMVYLPCHAVMACVTKVCQAWGPNCRTAPGAPPVMAVAASPAPPAPPAAPLVTARTT